MEREAKHPVATMKKTIRVLETLEEDIVAEHTYTRIEPLFDTTVDTVRMLSGLSAKSGDPFDWWYALRSSVPQRPVVQTQSRTAAALLIPPAIVFRPVAVRYGTVSSRHRVPRPINYNNMIVIVSGTGVRSLRPANHTDGGKF